MIAFNKPVILLFVIFALSLQQGLTRPTLPADENGTISLSLNQAVEHAINYNAEIQSARADIDIAKSQIREIMATGMPQVNASVGYQYYFEIPTSLVPAEFFGGDNAAFWSPMSWIIIFGLTVATFLTLVIVPCMYQIILSTRRKVMVWLRGSEIISGD